MLLPRALPLLLLACALSIPAASGRPLRQSGGAATGTTPTAGTQAPGVPQASATGATSAPLVASPTCWAYWNQAVAQTSPEAACSVLQEMGPDCAAELADEAAMEEAVSVGAVQILDPYLAILQKCGVPLPDGTSTTATPATTATSATKTRTTKQPASTKQQKPGCSVTDVEDCYAYKDDRAAVEECQQRNDERVRCCKSVSTTVC